MKNEIVVVGAGGHAKVVIELLRAMGLSVAYCIGGPSSVSACLGVPVLAGDENLTRLKDEGYSKTIIAIGSNERRQRLGETASSLGYRLVNAISPSAHLSPSARIGEGVAVMAGVVINADTHIDDLAIINTGASIDHDCVIGRAAHIAPQCGLAGSVTIGKRSFLGIGCKVIPGIRIGDDVIVGAGGVVCENIPDGDFFAGVPAKSRIRSIKTT